LKLPDEPVALFQIEAFRATSKRTRIETVKMDIPPLEPFILSEQHPREQGLKLPMWYWSYDILALLSEQHPREQGLKLGDVIYPSDTLDFQSNIQENKD